MLAFNDHFPPINIVSTNHSKLDMLFFICYTVSVYICLRKYKFKIIVPEKDFAQFNVSDRLSLATFFPSAIKLKSNKTLLEHYLCHINSPWLSSLISYATLIKESTHWNGVLKRIIRMLVKIIHGLIICHLRISHCHFRNF